MNPAFPMYPPPEPSSRGRLFLICFLFVVLVLIQIYCGAWLLPDQALPTMPDYQGSIFEPHVDGPVQLAEVTGYCGCPICCGKWADGRTATGTWATPGRTAAVDPSWFALGACLVIEGIGPRQAEDTGSAILGPKVDVFFDTHQEALEFGRQFLEVSLC